MNALQLIENYSDRSIVVIGNTKPVKDKLKELGGKFNPFLKVNGLTVVGWVFSVKRLEQIRTFINSFIAPVQIEQPVKVALPEVKPLPVIEAKPIDLIESFIQKAGKKYANKYIELCKEANICVEHAITNSIMRRKLYQFRTALEVNKAKNRKKEYHKPVEKEQPFKCRLIVTKNGDVNTIETTFKNSSDLEKFKKRMEKEANEQYCSVSFKYELI